MQALEELEKAGAHLAKARGLLSKGKPYDRPHHRQMLLYEANDRIQYVINQLKLKQERED